MFVNLFSHFVTHHPIVEFARKIRIKIDAKVVHKAKVGMTKPDRSIPVVLCIVKNGERLIRPFIRHYRALGIQQFVFLDTGSIDQTLAAAKEFAGITILSTAVKYKNNEFAMRRYLIEKFAKNKWSLFVDIDELFDYPHSDRMDLKTLIRYLDKNHFTAVTAQMLDMFSLDSGTDALDSQDNETPATRYREYELSNIQKFNLEDYEFTDWLLHTVDTKENYKNYFNNEISNAKIKFYTGGIRKTLFNIDVYLTKFPLIFCDDNIDPAYFSNAHFINGAKIADFSCILYHYKLTDTFVDQVKGAVKEDCYNCNDYFVYNDVIQSNPDVFRKTFLKEKSNNIFTLKNTGDLLEQGFIVTSERFDDCAGASPL